MSPVIVIPAFSRRESLARLLDSIVKSDFYLNPNNKIIISLDGGYAQGVLEVAECFVEENPTLLVELIKREKNIGLKEHILWCGGLTEEYGSVIVLEDDLIVSKDFYQYAKEALEFYKDDKNIAGVSLYGQRYNEYANLPFEPMPNGSDIYFMQVASSWGQAWTKKQWEDFKAWYLKIDSDYIKGIAELPQKVSDWPETSWKKFFSAYIVEKNKYFIYPFFSKTTNCADAGGQHTKQQINYLQVPCALNFYFNNYRFFDFKEKVIRYDSFMEAQFPKDFLILGVKSDLIAIDLYGEKPISLLRKYKYVITSKKCKEAIFKIDFRYKPIENNFLLYDASYNSKNIFHFSMSKSKDVFSKSRFYRVAFYFYLVEYFSYLKLKTKKFSLYYFLSFFRI